ncbi:hypothetical protein [Shewanella glacialipiscicola]|uniref:hypothetical protein n=1 Tax=Shewanella glacialipiscicola TaxID=614069 RepID=UPI003D796C13
MQHKQIALMVQRRHPEYEKKIDHWNFLQATYEGGREWFDSNIFRYMKEGDTEFKDRIKRAYRFNHSREVVDLVNKYIFKEEIVHNLEGANEFVVKFWHRSTRRNASISEYMRYLSKLSSIFGRIWIVVDSYNSGEGESIAEADVKHYSYEVTPQNVLDMSFDEEGNLNWILIREIVRDDNDPLSSTGIVFPRYRLWTKTSSVLFVDENAAKLKQKDKEHKPSYIVKSSHEHDLGEVPVFPLDHMISESLYTSPSMIGDIAYLDRAVANYLSNLDAIIQDQTFSQLAIPAQSLMPGDTDHSKVIEAGTKRIFTYDGEGGAKPFFMAPDPKQAELIITAIKQIINEIYHSVGVAGERTKSDNSMGIDNSSGVAKAYDFERVNSLLAAKTASLQRAEHKMVDLVLKWAGEKEEAKRYAESNLKRIIYPTNFDSRTLSDELSIAERLQLLAAPIEIRRYQLKEVVEKLYPYISEDTQKELNTAIDAMDDAEKLLLSKLTDSSGSPSATKDQADGTSTEPKKGKQTARAQAKAKEGQDNGQKDSQERGK